MNGSLSNKVALVTGGSRGIGAAIARRLAKNGAAVALTYVSAPGSAEEVVRGIEVEGGRALAIRADAADPEAGRAAVERTVETFDRLDVLVNNAGILMRGSVVDFGLGEFDRIVAVNVRAAFLATQAAVPYMRPGSRIINVGSMAADRSTYPGAAFYSMSKAAIAALTRGFAVDLAPQGITVNNVQPGPTLTDISAESKEMLAPLMPIGRLGTPDEIASLVAYLAGEESAFVTGSSWTIDGGFTA